jgi:DNA-binding NarL/FixJ family response regulator
MENTSPKIRIFIADSQDMFRDGLRRLLEKQPDFIVIGDSGDGEKIPSLVLKLKPDVLLLDMQLRKRSGIEVLSDIAAFNLPVRPLLLTADTEDREIMQALLQGARGVVKKDSATDLLFKSIRTIVTGAYWIGHSGIDELVKNLRHLADLVEKQSKLQTHGLTRQQLQIVGSIANGCSNKDIAQDLSISERTVKYHLTRIFAKLGVSGRMELARYSIRNKVITGT